MCVMHVFATHVIRMYSYTCKTPQTPHMYYRYGTTGHVWYKTYDHSDVVSTCLCVRTDLATLVMDTENDSTDKVSNVYRDN